MAFLEIAGMEMRVLEDSARRGKPRIKGGRQASEDNTMLSSERTPKRTYTAQVLFQSAAEFTAFQTLTSVAGSLGIATPVGVTSEADGLTMGETLTAYVDASEAQPFQYGGSPVVPAGVYWLSTLAIEEK